MATTTLSWCKSSLFLYPHKLSSLSHRQQQLFPQINWHAHEHPFRKRLSIWDCSIKKPRGSRKVKSNAELGNDIREFVSMVGFPEGHVPSTKELSEHGRKDLANIVRRRGYKLIKELLANSAETCNKESDAKKRFDEKHDVISDLEDNLTGQGDLVIDVDHVVEDIPSLSENLIMGNHHSTTLDTDWDVNSEDHSWEPVESLRNLSSNEKTSYQLEAQDKEAEQTGDDIFSFSSAIMDNHSSSSNNHPLLNSESDSSAPIESSTNLSLEEKALHSLKGQGANDVAEDVPLSTEVPLGENSSSSNVVQAFTSNTSICIPISASENLSLEEKVARFIQSGDLDTIEVGYMDAGESEGLIESDNVGGSRSKTLGKEHLEQALGGGDTMTLNRRMLTFKQNTPSVTVEHLPSTSAEGKTGADFDKDWETSKMENQLEIDHLEYMLHKKELELSLLKEQIEKEKLALSELQAKVEAEINKGQKLVSEKDEELHAAEENLAELKEVQIQYCGEGEIVEVAGSFNGWQHFIKMDPQPSTTDTEHPQSPNTDTEHPQPSTSVTEPTGSRKFRVWSTALWLYPGVYEIKFIVDGDWRIDPKIESFTRGHICNNILRVSR